MVPQLASGAIYDVAVSETAAQNWLLSAYDLELTSGTWKIEVGRFSFGLLSKLELLPRPDDTLLFKAGAFCEASGTSHIIVGGEHRNDSLFNYSFSSAPVFKSFSAKGDQALLSMETSKPIYFGDNVLLSAGAMVVGGTSIGTGSVLGAHSLATGTLEPFGIYGGVPARKLRDRFSVERQQLHRAARIQDVMAHQLPSLPRLLQQLEDGEIDLDQYRKSALFLPARARVAAPFSREANGRIAIGAPTAFFLGDTQVDDEANVRKLSSYFAQSGASGKIKWTPDIFSALQLYPTRQTG